MSQREIAILACRILGIYAVVLGVMVVPSLVGAVHYAGDGASAELLTMFFMSLFPLVAGLLLWRFAIPIGNRMARGLADAADEGAATAARIQAVAFSVVGVVVFVRGLPSLASLLIEHIVRAEDLVWAGRSWFERDGGRLIESGLYVLLGLALFFRGPRLAEFWRRSQRASFSSPAATSSHSR